MLRMLLVLSAAIAAALSGVGCASQEQSGRDSSTGQPSSQYRETGTGSTLNLYDTPYDARAAAPGPPAAFPTR